MLTTIVCAPPGPRKGTVPFAALPHDLVADPRLTPTEVRVASALLYWARSSDSCWPSDPSIAARVGRSRGTVQRCLRALEAAGWIAREKSDAHPNRRLIVLAWRRAGATLPVAPAAEPPPSPARHEGDVSSKETAKEDAERLDPRPRPEPEPAGATRPTAAPSPRPDPTPAEAIRAMLALSARSDPPAPAPARRRLRSLLTPADLEVMRLSGDPTLVAEAAKRLSPRAPRPRPSPPRSPEDLLSRIRECPTRVAAAAELLAQDLDDRKSWPALHRVCQRVWEGRLPPDALVTAWREATSGRARNPGAVFMTVVKRESRRG